MRKIYRLNNLEDTTAFYTVIRHIAYWLLGLNTLPDAKQLERFALYLPTVYRIKEISVQNPSGAITRATCRYQGKTFKCDKIGL